jgi:hypothetical protein
VSESSCRSRPIRWVCLSRIDELARRFKLVWAERPSHLSLAGISHLATAQMVVTRRFRSSIVISRSSLPTSVKKPVGMLLGLPLISYLSFFTEERGTLRLGRGSRRISKTNGPLIDDRRSTRGNRFATGDRAAIKETVGLRDGPPLLEAQPKILKSIDASNSVGLRAGRASVSSDEWHVDFPKSLDHFEFDLPSRLCQAVVVFRPSFRHAWLEAVGAIGDSVLGDGPQHLLI